MEQIKEKVKDLVDVQRYLGISNFLDDPASTLENYHFTDTTADLMVRWLSGVFSNSTNGECRAIAGYRGVGKSHFIAVFEMIVAHPELRSKIENQYVASGAQELLRRHYPVVHIKRGSAPTLFEELANAVALQFEIERSAIGSTAEEVLESAQKRAGELRLIVVVDTAPDRGGQVERNDGKMLGDIAKYCGANGVFLGLALDDDIAGADGDNIAISEWFSIDYLDQENLYKAVNAKVFVKDTRKQPYLQKLYSNIRNSTIGFRWSEERFSSLYPLHPITIEITPFIRQYIPTFSLMKFASESGEKILGRPADSLIGIEDLFDSTEIELRKNEELKTAFEAFDSIQFNFINRIPVQERHRTKLVLKALFLLSLVGTGASAESIVPAVMLYGVEDGEGPKSEVNRVLESFVSCTNDLIRTDRTNPDSVTYAIGTGKDQYAQLLARWVDSQQHAKLKEAFHSAVATVFPEFSRTDKAGQALVSVALDVVWRGSIRGGVLVFGDHQGDQQRPERGPEVEWAVYFDGPVPETDHRRDLIELAWKPDRLKPDEQKAILEFYGLMTDRVLQESFGEQLASATHAHSAIAKRIVERSLIHDAHIELEGAETPFPFSASNGETLAGLFSTMLTPVFDERYSAHPVFADTLTVEIVDRFVSCVYGKSIEATAEGDQLARNFGVPLGIIVADEGGLRRANKDELLKISCVSSLYDQIGRVAQHSIDIREAASLMRKSPDGFSAQAGSLLLAAMVSNGLIELVTSDGNRINGRSFDLKIDWLRVAAIALPRNSSFSEECLKRWAVAIVGDDSGYSLREPELRNRVLDKFIDISNSFSQASTPKSQPFTPEFAINTSVGCHLNRVIDNYGRIIDDVEATLKGKLDLEECVGKISVSFGENLDAFCDTKHSASVFDAFSNYHETVERVRDYVACCEYAYSVEVESARDMVISALAEFDVMPGDDNGREVERSFKKFFGLYSDLYLKEHSRTVASAAIRSEIDEILFSADWRRVGTLSFVEPFKSEVSLKVREIRRSMSRMNCKRDPAEYLQDAPFCVCSLRIADFRTLQDLPSRLYSIIRECNTRFDEFVKQRRESLLDHLSRSNGSEYGSFAGLELSLIVAEAQGLESLSQDQFELLVDAIAELDWQSP